MSIRNEALVCSTRNVSVAVPRDWYPDEPTVRSLAYISQQVLNILHLNIGRARVNFVINAKSGHDHVITRTPDHIWRTEASILVHPKLKIAIVSKRSDDNIAGIVAAAAVSTRYILFHPFTSEDKRQKVQDHAHELAVEFIANARRRQNT